MKEKKGSINKLKKIGSKKLRSFGKFLPKGKRMTVKLSDIK